MSSRERKRGKKVTAIGRPEDSGALLAAMKSVQRQVNHNGRPADQQQSGPEGAATFGGELSGENIAKNHKHQNDVDQQADCAGRQQDGELAHLGAGNEQNSEDNGKANGKYGVDLLNCIHRTGV